MLDLILKSIFGDVRYIIETPIHSLCDWEKTRNEITFSFSIHSTIGFDNMVQVLIEKGANINAVNENNNSAVILATLNGKISIFYGKCM